VITRCSSHVEDQGDVCRAALGNNQPKRVTEYGILACVRSFHPPIVFYSLMTSLGCSTIFLSVLSYIKTEATDLVDTCDREEKYQKTCRFYFDL
jgi:hypothetical protein